MSFSERLSEIKTGFERPFWVANITELFERLSYYAVFTVIVRYLHENLKFSSQEASSLSGNLEDGFGFWRFLEERSLTSWAFAAHSHWPI